MKNHTQKELEDYRPTKPAKDLIDFVLSALYSDAETNVESRLSTTINCTFEELIGALLKCRDELGVLDLINPTKKKKPAAKKIKTLKQLKVGRFYKFPKSKTVRRFFLDAEWKGVPCFESSNQEIIAWFPCAENPYLTEANNDEQLKWFIERENCTGN